MPLSSQSGYGPGSSYTNAGGADFGPASMAAALLAREGQYLGQRAAAAPVRRAPAPMRYAAQPPPAPVGAGTTGSLGQAPQDAPVETPWYSYQGAATRLTGLSPQMIPGMAVDEKLLPPSMRHSSSSFVPTGITAASALSPERNPAPWDPYDAGRRLDGPGVALGPGADFARRQLAAAAGR